MSWEGGEGTGGINFPQTLHVIFRLKDGTILEHRGYVPGTEEEIRNRYETDSYPGSTVLLLRVIEPPKGMLEGDGKFKEGMYSKWCRFLETGRIWNEDAYETYGYHFFILDTTDYMHPTEAFGYDYLFAEHGRLATVTQKFEELFPDLRGKYRKEALMFKKNKLDWTGVYNPGPRHYPSQP